MDQKFGNSDKIPIQCDLLIFFSNECLCPHPYKMVGWVIFFRTLFTDAESDNMISSNVLFIVWFCSGYEYADPDPDKSTLNIRY